MFKNRSVSTELYLDGNLAFDVSGEPLSEMLAGTEVTRVKTPVTFPADVQVLPSAEVKRHIADNVGSRPWDRNPVDQRIVSDALAGKGRIIDSEQEVGGYPNPKPTSAVFDQDEWNLETMERR